MMGSSSHRAAAAAAATGIISLLLGFFSYPRNPTHPWAGLGILFLGGVLVLIALLLVATAGLLALRRAGGERKLALVLAAVWLLAGFAAGLTLSGPDQVRCQEPLSLLADVAGGAPGGAAALAVGIVVVSLAWLTVAVSRRLWVGPAVAAVAPGLAIAGVITVVMAGLLVIGRSPDSFQGNAACAVLSGLMVGSAFALGFLGMGLFLVAVALFVRPAGPREPIKLWLLTPALAGLWLVAHFGAISLVAYVQRPIEVEGTISAELRSTTAAHTVPAGPALCTRSHDGYLHVEGNEVVLDLFDDGSVSSLHVFGEQFKIWTASRGQVALATGPGWPTGTATSDGMEQLDAVPGDAEARWRAIVTWDCSAGR